MAKEVLTAYCMKTKTKNVPFKGLPEVKKTVKGGFFCVGEDKDGNRMSCILGEAKALQAIKDGVAKKAF